MEAYNGSYKTEKKNNASGMVLKRCTIVYYKNRAFFEIRSLIYLIHCQ
jgi:hypothetical protein